MNVYQRLGVRRVINGMGAVTFLGGLPMSATVRAAMAEAAQVKVDLFELGQAAGNRIAELLGAPAAMITTGAAAGWQLAAAACVTGSDPAAIARLPRIVGGRDEIVIHRKHRGNFDHALRATGVRLVEFGYSRDRTEAWELQDAISERTVAVAYVTDFGDDTVLPLSTVVDIARARGVPVIVDAATSLPPASNLTALPASGADLVSFSGGKDVGGPQNTGFVVGRADLVAACVANTSPHHNTIGRAMKVPAESMVGLVTALEEYLSRDHDADAARWRSMLDDLRVRLDGLAVRAQVEATSYYGMPIPQLRIDGVADPQAVLARLAAGDPSVRLGQHGGSLTVNPHALSRDDVPVLGTLLVEALKEVQP